MSTRMEDAAVRKCVELGIIESETNRRLLDQPATWLTPWGCQLRLQDLGWQFMDNKWRKTLAVGDTAYYNGLLFGYVGTIAKVHHLTATMYSRHLGWVTCSQWQWDEHNKRWWCDVLAHSLHIKSDEI